MVKADMASLCYAVAAGSVQGSHHSLYLLRRELTLRVSALLHQVLTVGICVQPLHVRLKQQGVRQSSRMAIQKVCIGPPCMLPSCSYMTRAEVRHLEH